MRKMLMDMARGAVVFAAVGMIIGGIFAIPAVGAAFASMGVAPTIISAIHLGTWWPVLVEGFSFGLFGALTPPIQKLWGMIFGDRDAQAAAQQQSLNNQLVQHVSQLEAQQMALAHEVESVPRSRAVQQVLAQGPRAETAQMAMNDSLSALLHTTPMLEQAENYLRAHQEYALADKLNKLLVDAGNMFADGQGWRVQGNDRTIDTHLQYQPVTPERLQAVLGEVHAKMEDAALAKNVSDSMRAMGLRSPGASTHVAQLMDARRDVLLHDTNSATLH